MTRLSLTLVLCLTSACQILGGYESFEEARGESSSRCSVLSATKSDHRDLAVMSRVDLGGAACIWMDSTEVTVHQYARWVEEVAADEVQWEPAFCSWKQQREDPMTGGEGSCRAAIDPHDFPPFAREKPIRCVDWCEAQAFCHWADKRLCYDFGYSGVQGPRAVPREWRAACSNGQTTAYPWGNSAEGSRCNAGNAAGSCLAEGQTCGVFAVEAWDSCRSNANVADLLGNVAEWVYSCNLRGEDEVDVPTGCLILGGGYD